MLSWKCGEVSVSKFSDNLKYNTRLKPSPSASPRNTLAGYVGNWDKKKRNIIELCSILVRCSNRNTMCQYPQNLVKVKLSVDWVQKEQYVVWDGEWTCILTIRREGTFSCSFRGGRSRCLAMWFIFRGQANKSTPIGS